MRLLFVAVLALVSVGARAEYGKFGPSEFSKEGKEVVLVAWNSDEGRRRLGRAKINQDYFQLASQFQPQGNPLTCGIAVTTMLLNAFRLPTGTAPSQAALEVVKPEAFIKAKTDSPTIPFPAYSQITLLNKATDKVKPKEKILLQNITRENTKDATAFDPGLALAELAGVMNVYELQTVIRYADVAEKNGADEAEFRKDVVRVVDDKTNFLVVNFKGASMGATTGGHISTLAAYDEDSDSVLILDVAGHKNPWYWAPVAHLYKAMTTKDGAKTRGYLVVSDGTAKK